MVGILGDTRRRRCLMHLPFEGILEEFNERQRCTRNAIVLGLQECESSSPAAVREHDRGLIERILGCCGLASSLNGTRFF
ncbi:hypothetical protein J6590_078920 [Homalodisca vitripennis]|nr:hypothetical protein J6590_078920 [Homalodisca vitripennis]